MALWGGTTTVSSGSPSGLKSREKKDVTVTSDTPPGPEGRGGLLLLRGV